MQGIKLSSQQEDTSRNWKKEYIYIYIVSGSGALGGPQETLSLDHGTSKRCVPKPGPLQFERSCRTHMESIHTQHGHHVYTFIYIYSTRTLRRYVRGETEKQNHKQTPFFLMSEHARAALRVRSPTTMKLHSAPHKSGPERAPPWQISWPKVR